MTTGLTVGETVATTTVHLDRTSLVRYAGASGDFNPIHFRDDFAQSVGLPGVLAHGMLTMGLAIQPVLEFLGTKGRVIDYGVRFTRPVLVDAIAGADVSTAVVVGAVMDDAVRFDLTVTYDGNTVLGKAQVQVVFD
jgi:acyl dehydratase